MSGELVKIESFRYQLAVAETYEEIKTLDTKAAAIAEIMRKEHMSKQRQDELGVFRIEIESKKGAWLDEMFPNGGERGNQYKVADLNNSSLADLGIGYNESANARLINRTNEENPELIKEIVEEIKSDPKRTVTPFAVQKDLRDREKKEKLKEKKEENKKIDNSEIKIVPIIHNISFKEFLNKIDDNSQDLLITDPPFSTDIEDIESFVNEWLSLALAKIKPNGRGYICIGAYPKEINAYLNEFARQDKFILDNPLIWTYRNTLGVTPKMKYNLNYQMILHCYSNESDNLDTSITNEMFSVQDINAPDGRVGNRYHKWQKPNELARRLIKHSTKEGDSIIDPFAGSGTFLVQAGRMNRYAEGCDIDIEAINLCKERGCYVQ